MKDGTDEFKLINIGFGNIVAANRIIAIVAPDSAPSNESSRTRGTRVRSSTPRTGAGPAPSSSPIAATSYSLRYSPRPLPIAS